MTKSKAKIKIQVKCTYCQNTWVLRGPRMPLACPGCGARATRHPIVKVTQEAKS